MTACDLGAITKPWDIQQKVAQKIADEFFYQGDLERDELHLLPSAQMDRANRAEFPTMQVTQVTSPTNLRSLNSHILICLSLTFMSVCSFLHLP